MASKTKSGLTETPKSTPATPRVSKLSRGVTKSDPDSPSPVQNSRISPRSITSKPVADRRPSKIATPPEKPHITRPGVAKGSELQAQLNLLQEDLKKAKEQISIIEKEKANAIDELKQAQKLAEEANEKLLEAQAAQKRAEDNSEIEKFRAVELEQAGIETVQKKEEEWQKELENIRNQHALDVAALLSTTQELQKAKHELAMTTDAKNQALSHADDATKIAEIHADKVQILSTELTRLKALLDSKLETEAAESSMNVKKLKEEIDELKQELERAKAFEASIEQLNVELEAAKMAESYARSLAEEWKSKVDELERNLEEANKLERSASESLCSVMKQLEGNNDLLHDAESEISGLKEKVELLEMTIARQKEDLDESERSLGVTKQESLEMAKKVESLKLELEAVKEEKTQALNNEKLAASSVQSLLEEKNKLINDLEMSREEEEKSKKAMESLASALHEVSAEAREAKEKLLSNQVECESYETQIEDLRLVLKEANQRYETILDESKHELDLLKNTIEESKVEFERSMAEWEKRELDLVSRARKSEEENSSLEREIDRLVNLLKETEEEACVTREGEAQLKESLKEVEAEVISLQETLGEAKIESVKLKESLLDKENELQSLFHENEDFRTKEIESQKKIEELSKLLEEALAKNRVDEKEFLTDSEKDYDLLPKVVEFSEENGHSQEEKAKTDPPPHQQEENAKEENGFIDDTVALEVVKTENVNGKPKEDKDEDSVEVEFKMWESCKIEKKEFSPEREVEHESVEDEGDSKVEGGESFDQINGLSSSTENVDGGVSPTKEQQQKKKKPLLRKFGNLLKKKSTTSQK